MKGLTRKGMGWGRGSDITYRREKRLAGPGVLSWRSTKVSRCVMAEGEAVEMLFSG